MGQLGHMLVIVGFQRLRSKWDTRDTLGQVGKCPKDKGGGVGTLGTCPKGPPPRKGGA